MSDTPNPIKLKKQEAAEIWQDSARYRSELLEIYKYFMPWRTPTAERAPQSGGNSEGATITDVLFDASGVEAAINFAGQVQADWMPHGEPFMALEPGPLVPHGEGKNELAKVLQRVADVAHGVAGPVIPTKLHETAFDLFGGTGAMLLLKGDSYDPFRCLTVPTVELGLRNGPYGDIWHHVWKRNWRAAHIPVMWPNAKISNTLAMRIKNAPQDWVPINQYTFFDPTARAWVHHVWADGDDEKVLLGEDGFRVKPWVTPRMFVMPGETFGRGLGHLALPFVKTANKARELALTAAAFAIMGIFTRRADNVFNPQTAVFQPLAFWNVAYNGGPLGPTISRLPIPADFDVSSIVQQEERDQIRRVTLNDELPAEQMAVRSATEVAGRMKKYAKRYGGVNVRIGTELVGAATARIIDILEEMNLLAAALGGLQTNIRIDNLLTKVTVKSPAVTAQRADRVEQAVNYLQIVMMLFGPQAAMLSAKVQELMPEMARWMGIEERFLPSKDEQKQFVQLMATIVAQSQEKASLPKMPTPQPSAPYVNGGGL